MSGATASAMRQPRVASVVAATARPMSLPSRLLRSGLAWSVVVCVLFAVWVLVGLGGARYYTTPQAVRGYAPGHHLLRPSGPAGQMFGLVGAALLLMPFLYMARKRSSGFRGAGSLRTWLEIHLFCGIVGPVLITFHTSFKFNGIVSAAYWSMVVVALSGFVGRYLYGRIPRSIRGAEMTRAELDARADELWEAIAGSVTSPTLLARIEAFERDVVPDADAVSWLDLVFGEIALGGRLRALNRGLERAGLPPELRGDILRLTNDRATLLRRLAYLQRSKQLFELWHVFHLPLVYLMLVIVTAHVGITLYLGYIPFRW